MKYYRCVDCKYHFRIHDFILKNMKAGEGVRCRVCGSYKVTRSNKTEWAKSKDLRDQIPVTLGYNES